MSVVTTAELVNEGHNILDRGIGIAYDAHSKNTKVIYRSRVGLDAAGGNVTYLASTELGTPGWSSPIQVTKPRDRAVSAEFLAYVIPDHPAGTPDIHNEFLFSVYKGRLNQRSRKGQFALWSTNTKISETILGSQEIAATSIGQKLVVYAWDEDERLVEFTRNIADANQPWDIATVVPDMPELPKDGNKNLAVTRTPNGICLLFSGAAQQIWWRHRGKDDKWGAAKAIITNDVHIRSPMSILVIPYVAPPKNLKYTFPTEAPPKVHCYPITIGEIPELPCIEDPGKCEVRYAVAYIDTIFTAQIQRIDENGESSDKPRRIGRINAQTFSSTRPDVPFISIIPGVYPGTLTVIAISALHGREVLLTLSLVAPRPLVKKAAKSSALLDAALAEHNTRLAVFTGFRNDLAAAQAWLAENPDSPEYIVRAARRDHLGIRYLLATEELNAARMAVWRAQVAAIHDYNKVILSCFVSHMRPIKTEVRYMCNDQPVFPVIPNGGILPDD